MFYRTSLSARTIKLTSLLSALLFASGNAVALGLGNLVVHSRLGQALRAEVRLIETPGTSHPGETCFRLGAADGNEDLPVLTHARLRLEQSGGQSRLLITSLQTINEPVLRVNVHVGCGAELVRSFTLLIDPEVAGSSDSMAERGAGGVPADIREKARRAMRAERLAVSGTAALSEEYPTTWDIVSGESAQSITRALFPRQPRAQRRFLNALREANPQIDFGVNGDVALASGVSLAIPDTRRAAVVKKAPDRATEAPPRAPKKPAAVEKPALEGTLSDRLMISGDAAAPTDVGADGHASDPSLRLSSDLSIRMSDTVSENARAMLRVEYKLLNALVFQAEKQLELAEQIRNLEVRFDEMRAANAGAMKTADEVLAVPETQPVVDREPPKAMVAPVEVTATDGIGWWRPILLMLVVAGALAWWLTRRHRAGKAADAVLESSPETEVKSLPAASAMTPRANPSPTDLWEAAAAEAPLASRLDVPLEVARPLPFRDDDGARTVPPALAIEVSHVEEADDSSTVLELAEIMVSFGRIKGAAQALAEYLENNPDTSLFPWLKLLEIYRTNDMQDEFVACAARLRSHFNVAPASWDEARGCLGDRIEPLNENDLSIEDLLRKLPTVGTFPHIQEGIVKTWDTSEGVAYMKHLLRDTRNGQRTGFPLSIARELLFLLDLQETRLRNTA